MAGPTIQLRAKFFGNTEKSKIKTLLKRNTIISEEEGDKFDFNFKKGKTLGLFLKANSCAFLMDFSSKTDDHDELQKKDFTLKIKDKPAVFINISAMCNGSEDHRLLANFALEINKITGGFIDLNGAIIPDLEKDKAGNYIHQTHQDYQNFVNAIQGTIHEIHYHIDDNRTSYYHICDAVWLFNWTLSPNFKLIK
jgi:Family of unknown function (DUF6368)